MPGDARAPGAVDRFLHFESPPRAGQGETMTQLQKKKDRSGPLAGVGIAACFISAYGFSNESPLFMWMLPTALVGLTAVWAYWPHRPAE